MILYLGEVRSLAGLFLAPSPLVADLCFLSVQGLGSNISRPPPRPRGSSFHPFSRRMVQESWLNLLLSQPQKQALKAGRFTAPSTSRSDLCFTREKVLRKWTELVSDPPHQLITITPALPPNLKQWRPVARTWSEWVPGFLGSGAPNYPKCNGLCWPRVNP